MITIPLLQGKAMLIEIPEGATNTAITPRTSEQQELLYNMPNTLYALTGAILPPGTWQIVGMLSEITEEQAAGMVAWVETGQYYVDYRVDGWWNGDITALESLESAILAEGGKELNLERCVLLVRR